MRRRAGHKLILAWIAASLLFLTGNAQAVSLGKIEVASFLGEPFYAEVSLRLDDGELPNKVIVEIASASEYKIFEVFRDQVLKSIRINVVSDSRGARVKLSSRSKLKSPFFNLILKTQYNRVTHFKKIPVFLELPKSILTITEKSPLPSVQATRSSAVVQPQMASNTGSEKAKDHKTSIPRFYDGWARTGRYGPIVHGDSLSTVARRLRIDKRYDLNQVMVALFEKNRGKFNQNNMNLLKAGSYLDVPEAAEVEHLSRIQAHDIMADHEKRWKQLTKQPHYAAEKEAQRTRYSKRIQLGQSAGGAGGTLVTTQALKKPVKKGALPIIKKPVSTAVKMKSETSVSEQISEPTVPEYIEKTGVPVSTTAIDMKQDAVAESASHVLIASLKKKNEELRMQLKENEKLLNLKITSVIKTTNEASRTEIKKLEVLVSQLQVQLEKVREEAQSKQGEDTPLIISLLYSLVAILLGIVALLVVRRRKPVHPAVETGKKGLQTPVVKSKSTVELTPKTVEQADINPTDVVDRETEEFSKGIADSNNALTDTDTVETGPVDTAQEKNSTHDIDHLSDADMYIRYGMEDEALQQLDMALHSHPDNIEAHIRKIEVLHSSKSLKGFEEAVAVAGSVLAGVALERFNSTVAALNDTDDISSDDDSSGLVPSAAIEEFHDPIEESSAASIAFDDEMQKEDGIEFNGVTANDSTADDSDLNWQHETSDLDIEELDWLQDVPLASDDFLTIEEVEEQPENSENQESGIETVMDEAVTGSTQELDHLLSEFAGDDDVWPEDLVLEQTKQDVGQQESSNGSQARKGTSDDRMDGEIDQDADSVDTHLSKLADGENKKKT